MHQPLQTYKGDVGAYILEGEKKIQLSKNKHQTVTEAGRVYWEDILGVPPPRKYDYNQPLEQDKFIRSRTGEKVRVRRRRADGSYDVLPVGEAYFRHHKALWIPSVPRLIVKKVNGEFVAIQGKGDYVSLAGLPHMTTATLKGGAEEEQRMEAVSLAMKYIRKQDELTVQGVSYNVLFYDSEVYHVYNPEKAVRVNKQLTEFHANTKPTVTTTLNRLLKGSPCIPELLWRPADCHADSFGEYDNCVVRMMYKCATRRRKRVATPLFTEESVEQEFDVCFEECGLTVGEYPYEEGEGWRQGGVPSTMAIRFCKRQTEKGNPIACSIFHNNFKIFEYYPEGYRNHAVFSIQENHCYFYTEARWVAKMTPLVPLRDIAYSCCRASVPFRQERAKPWAEWRPYSSMVFDTGTKRQRDSTKVDALPYYTMDDDLEDIYEELVAANIGVRRVFGTDPEGIVALYVQDAVVRAVPPMANDLDAIARLAGFKYRGSSLSKFGDDLRVACLKLRPDIPVADRELVKARQGYLCAQCEDPALRDIDHITPRAAGGQDCLDNYQALCQACHALKTEQESCRYKTAWHSSLSRDTLEAIIAAPSPRQIVFGDGKEATELDVVSCRTSALTKTEWLPIADILDKPQPYEAGKYFDLIFIDAGRPCLKPKNYCAYSGPGWYAREHAEWALRVHNGAGTKITTDHFIMAFVAHRHISGKTVEATYDMMDEFVRAGVQCGSQARDSQSLPKLLKLAMQGRWNIRYVQTWSCVESTTRDDAHPVVHKERLLDNGKTKYMTQMTEMDNKTMALFSLISLSMEQLMVCKALQVAERMQLNVHGCIVDSVLFSSSKKSCKVLTLPFHRDGTDMLQVKGKRLAPRNDLQEREVTKKRSHWRAFAPCRGTKIGTNAYGAWMHDPHFAHKREWRTLEEAEGLGTCDQWDTFHQEAADRIVENRGGRISGRGGVGKTEAIKLVAEGFKAKGFTVRVVATTHVQAANADGKTIMAHLHGNARSKGYVLIIDELSMVSLETFTHLAKAAFVGVLFVVVGDEFQIQPIGEDLERWEQLPESDFMHDLCNGLCVKFRKFRRRQLVGGVYEPGDWEHFKQVGLLYTENVLTAVAMARLWYPNTGAEVQTTLCVTNKRRKAVNASENRRLAPAGAIWCEYGGDDTRAQSFFCWPGLELQAGQTDKLMKNGIRHTVVSVDRDECRLLTGGTELAMGTALVAGLFRPTHALTIDSAQARTLMGGVRVVETNHSFFSLRRLIVALGRSPTGACVQME